MDNKLNVTNLSAYRTVDLCPAWLHSTHFNLTQSAESYHSLVASRCTCNEVFQVVSSNTPIKTFVNDVHKAPNTLKQK